MNQEDIKPTVDQDFFDAYTREASHVYYDRHRRGLGRRLSHWLECRMARKALSAARNLQTVFDLPCGAGRFWPVLAEETQRRLFAADKSEPMVNLARATQPGAVARRFQCLRTSAFAIGLRDNSVDCVFCMRLLHHVEDRSLRLTLLKELYRVSRKNVCISLWVGGTLQALKQSRREHRRGTRHGHSRFIADRRVAEGEFREVGFTVKDHFDLFRYFSMWRIYLLQKHG